MLLIRVAGDSEWKSRKGRARMNWRYRRRTPVLRFVALFFLALPTAMASSSPDAGRMQQPLDAIQVTSNPA